MKKQTKLSLNQEIKVGGNNTREKRIQNCEWCKGQPETEPINLPDFEGEKCANPECYEVISYEKIKK